MLPGRAAAWTPANHEVAHVTGLGAPRLCGHVDRLAVEPGALPPLQHAVPTQSPCLEPEPVWHLYKPPQVRTADFPLPSAELHLRGLPCGTSSDS